MAANFSQKKLFGPFNGLNDSQSPFLREQPPAPNAAPREYATEFNNLIIDQKTSELLSRNGIEYIDKGAADPSILQSKATSGIFKWIDYDAVDGNPRQRAVQLSVDELGIPTVIAYRLIKTEVRLISNTLDGKSFAIIEDPASSNAKRFVVYNSNGSVFASYTDLTAIPNVIVTYVDWNQIRDGEILAAGVDLLSPVTLTYSAVNGTPTSTAQFYSIAAKSTTNADLNLNSWLLTLTAESGAYFTAAQASNILYFSGGGVCPVLKYDGQNLYKAGMPHAALHGDLTVVKQTPSDFKTAHPGTNITTAYTGLMAVDIPANEHPLGNFMWINTYEHGDAKNNFIEGDPYLPGTYYAEDTGGTPILGTHIVPKFSALSSIGLTGGVYDGYVYQYLPNSLRSSDGFDARGALLKSNSVTYTQTASANVIVTQTAHGRTVGELVFMTITSGTAVSGIYTITAVTTSTFTYNSGGVLTTSGNANCSCVLRTLGVASDFALTTDGTNNTLKMGDLVCVRATVYTDAVSTSKLPILITARLSAKSLSTLTFDADYPITVELVPGGDYVASGSLLSGVTTDTLQTIISALTSITTWAGLASFTWVGLSAYTNIKITDEFAVSNNLRINIYRNKANGDEDNAYNALANDGTFVPPLYLVNILPNNPFQSTTTMGAQYDNAYDASLGALLVPKTALLVADKGVKDLTKTDYSPLPKGRAISSDKGRVYLTDDVENENIVWRSDLVYGTEYFSANDTLNVETPAGDKPSIAMANGSQIFVLKENSIKAIISDLSNTDIRLDDLAIGEYGCVAPRSAVPLKTGVAYLSSKGPVYIEVGSAPVYLGENKNSISRIRNAFSSSTLDLSRAVAWVDTFKDLYLLYVPTISKPSAGLFNPADVRYASNPYYTDQGTMFIYDYANDAWSTFSGVNAKGGMVDLEGRMFYLMAYAKNISESSSGLEWVLYKERAYGNLWSFGDRIERQGTVELRAISKAYATDWLAYDDANMLKKFLRLKAYGLRVFSDLTVKDTSGAAFACTGAYSLTAETYKDWRTDAVQSSSTLALTSSNLFALMKVRNNKSGVMKFRVTHNTLFQSPRIQALEVEIAAPYEPKMKAWGTP